MNQPPQTDKQTGKRIVSENEFARFQAKRTGIRSIAMFLMLSGGVSAVAVLAALASISSTNKSGITDWGPALCILFCPVYAGFALLIGYGMKKKAEQMDDEMPYLILVTRANTADLPASDSLVRASEEPVQQPQAVLLRATAQGQEKYEEQLLRAAAGGTE